MCWWELYPWTNLHDLNLDWVIEVCKKALSEVDGFPKQIDNLQKQIDSNKNDIVALQNTVSEIENLKWDWSEEIAESLEAAKNYTNEIAQVLHNDTMLHVSELQDLISLEGKYSNSYTDIEISNLKSWMEDIPLPAVLNPLNGKMESISKVLADLFNLQKIKALTANELDSLKLTAEELDDYDLTAYDFDFWAGQYLQPGQNYWSVRNPFTGEIDTIQNVLDELSAFHKDGSSASHYDNLEFTAEEYDSLLYTAYEYDNVPTN